jgi:hypothetical protein
LSGSRRQKSKRSRSSKSPRTPAPPASSKGKKDIKPGPGKSLNYRTIGGGCLRPGVSLGLIDLEGNILSTRPIGIVDSGADSTTLPLEWASRLGIDHEADCIAFKGGTAGGAAEQFLYEPGIHGTFLGKKLRLGAIFAPLCPQVLLGREDFFRYFKSLRFEQSKEKMHLDGVDDWAAATVAVGQSLERLAAGIKYQVAREAEEAAAAP